MNGNSSIIKQQAEKISGLEAQLSKQQGPANGKGLKADKSRIKELESDIENLKVCSLLPG